MPQGIVKNSRAFSQQLVEPDNCFILDEAESLTEISRKEPDKESPAKTLSSRDTCPRLCSLPNGLISPQRNRLY